jgi:hypothetical protein
MFHFDPFGARVLRAFGGFPRARPAPGPGLWLMAEHERAVADARAVIARRGRGGFAPRTRARGPEAPSARGRAGMPATASLGKE